ncbi:hypothetical protein HPT27_13055 [Permianibacter sp. IMCC34836]|uniref:DUF411 domain-containing protein n=1 Tax=Permianibacter fluminis TaxID=2738515 RepID=UPI00155608F5|nr:DUF411 domain-containing protein [Permianibacter fluminis]NQD37953.1 hypothetical protein [Permianibacter fluminis]
MSKSLVFAAAFLLLGCSVAEDPSARDKSVLVYKTPTCPCCATYVRYLERNGYTTHVVDLAPSQLSSKREALGVPAHQQSCHTSIFQKYVVEGHVPIEAIEHLLASQPTVRGISVPAMPLHSPGMGPRGNKPLPVYLLVNAGEVPVPFEYPDPALIDKSPHQETGPVQLDLSATRANSMKSPDSSSPEEEMPQ